MDSLALLVNNKLEVLTPITTAISPAEGAVLVLQRAALENEHPPNEASQRAMYLESKVMVAACRRGRTRERRK